MVFSSYFDKITIKIHAMPYNKSSRLYLRTTKIKYGKNLNVLQSRYNKSSSQ
jgi:hypothetical protein